MPTVQRHPSDEGQLRRAALYLRMSTDMQTYSLDHQRSARTNYASRHKLTIVASYEDPARSGLRMTTRPGLRALIADVLSGPEFEFVLVYDVSRSGRFQDADEAAYYEFLCRANGVGVRYCEEGFDGETGVAASLMKAMKRVMAAEYSRELSQKVRRGHKRLFDMGFHQGGPAVYATRRWLAAAKGRQARLLNDGERKSLHDDRVVLKAGPVAERRLVHRIFTTFAVEGRSASAIAADLNADGRVNARGRPWRRQNVIDILQNEIYIGVATYAKVTQSLGSGRTRQPSHAWWRRADALAPIVTLELFRRAQERLLRLPRPWTEEAVLSGLRRLLAQEGKLNTPLIDASVLTPSAETVARHFCGLHFAYARLGYVPARATPRRKDPAELSSPRARALAASGAGDEALSGVREPAGPSSGRAELPPSPLVKQNP